MGVVEAPENPPVWTCATGAAFGDGCAMLEKTSVWTIGLRGATSATTIGIGGALIITSASISGGASKGSLDAGSFSADWICGAFEGARIAIRCRGTAGATSSTRE